MSAPFRSHKLTRDSRYRIMLRLPAVSAALSLTRRGNHRDLGVTWLTLPLARRLPIARRGYKISDATRLSATRYFVGCRTQRSLSLPPLRIAIGLAKLVGHTRATRRRRYAAQGLHQRVR